jgi:hypothetical protein
MIHFIFYSVTRGFLQVQLDSRKYHVFTAAIDNRIASTLQALGGLA